MWLPLSRFWRSFDAAGQLRYHSKKKQTGSREPSISLRLRGTFKGGNA